MSRLPEFKTHATEVPGKSATDPRDPRWYYTLVGANGEPMSTSELYASEENAKRGIDDHVAAVLAIAVADGIATLSVPGE